MSDHILKNIDGSVLTVTLYRPEFHLIRQADGSWSFARSFHKRVAAEATGEPWSFTSTEIQIIDGSARTSNLGALPEAVAQGKVFDYTHTQIHGQGSCRCV